MSKDRLKERPPKVRTFSEFAERQHCNGSCEPEFPIIEAKPWGRSICVYRDELIEIVKIEVVAGGFCSVHLHRYKSNEFSIASGLLSVFVENGFDGVVESKLKRTSDPIAIPPDARHCFHAHRSPVVAWEIYRAAPCCFIDEADIVRFSRNGVGSIGSFVFTENTKPLIFSG